MHYFLNFNDLKARAAALNMNMPALCQAAGVSSTTVQRWENEATKPQVSTLVRLTEALVSLEQDMLAHLLELHPYPPEESTGALAPGRAGRQEARSGYAATGNLRKAPSCSPSAPANGGAA